MRDITRIEGIQQQKAQELLLHINHLIISFLNLNKQFLNIFWSRCKYNLQSVLVFESSIAHNMVDNTYWSKVTWWFECAIIRIIHFHLLKYNLQNVLTYVIEYYMSDNIAHMWSFQFLNLDFIGKILLLSMLQSEEVHHDTLPM